MKYYPSREASSILGVCPDSLRKWADNGQTMAKLTASELRQVKGVMMSKIMLENQSFPLQSAIVESQATKVNSDN